MNSITIRSPDDFHVHLRDGPMLKKVARETALPFARALVMPNLDPPVLTGEDARAYRSRILEAVTPGMKSEWGKKKVREFEPLMTIKLTPETTPSVLEGAQRAGVIAAKLYPDRRPDDEGGEVTTGSGGGIYTFDCYPGSHLDSVLGAMSELGLVLCVHAEDPAVETLLRERAFVERFLPKWAKRFSRLRIVIEHATTESALSAAHHLSNVACSITAHHLVITLDDVIGGRLDPHCFCKPVAKSPRKRRALVDAATAANPNCFFGSDSAPHNVSRKWAGAAGCYTAPVALPLLAEVFEQRERLDNLAKFVSTNGAEFYGLPLNEGTVTLTKEPWRVAPAQNPRPFWDHREYSWKVTWRE